MSVEREVYAKLGYSMAQFVNNDGSGDNAKLKGYLLGLGYKFMLNSQAYLFVEGDYTTMKSNKVIGADPEFTIAKYSYDVSGYTVNAVAGVGYRF